MLSAVMIPKNECHQLMIDTINDKLDAALPETGDSKKGVSLIEASFRMQIVECGLRSSRRDDLRLGGYPVYSDNPITAPRNKKRRIKLTTKKCVSSIHPFTKQN